MSILLQKKKGGGESEKASVALYAFFQIKINKLLNLIWNVHFKKLPFYEENLEHPSAIIAMIWNHNEF